MGGSDMGKTAKEKEAKTSASTTQEQSSTVNTATANPDWPGFQAYSPIAPPGYPASSPQAYPYMWGVQHIMPPYATPPHPYVAMYPHGGLYAHPNMPPGSYPFGPFPMQAPNGMAEASGNTPDADGKPSDAKEKLPIKRSKGSLGSLNKITGKNTDVGKTTGVSGNGIYSKSAESGSEGTSDGSDANSQNDLQMKTGGRQDSTEAEASQNSGSVRGPQNGEQGVLNTIMSQTTPVVHMPATGALPGPPTNLNIGMDYWGTPTPVTALPGKVPSTPVGMVTPGSRDSAQSHLWLQDERELKRQRRKQSNRESARRSRLRKQVECDELAQRAETLREENASLKSELNQIKTEYEQLLAENAHLKERLQIPCPEDFTTGDNDQHFTVETQQTEQDDVQRGS